MRILYSGPGVIPCEGFCSLISCILMGMKGPGGVGGVSGKTSDEGGSEQSIATDGRVYGGRGVVEIVRTAAEHQGRGENSSSVLSIRVTDTFEEVVFRRII